MTEPGIYYPETLTAQQLDAFLARGWYRMGQGIFTTNFIVHDDEFYRVYWLRYALGRIAIRPSLRKILKANTCFETRIEPLVIDDEMEALFLKYKTGINFEPALSVEHWLYDNASKNVYDSWVVKVLHNGLLVAAGIFDKGRDALAGIINFYDPAYKKYSPGKYVMLQKILHAQTLRMNWYYPGYIVHGYPKFNYKLFAGEEAAELYIPEQNQWQPYETNLPEKLANQHHF